MNVDDDDGSRAAAVQEDEVQDRAPSTNNNNKRDGARFIQQTQSPSPTGKSIPNFKHKSRTISFSRTENEDDPDTIARSERINHVLGTARGRQTIALARCHSEEHTRGHTRHEPETHHSFDSTSTGEFEEEGNNQQPNCEDFEKVDTPEKTDR